MQITQEIEGTGNLKATYAQKPLNAQYINGKCNNLSALWLEQDSTPPGWNQPLSNGDNNILSTKKIKWHLRSTEGHVLDPCLLPYPAASGYGAYFNRAFSCCRSAVERALTPISFGGCQSAPLLLKYFSIPLWQPQGCLHADCCEW